jgi:hypothetical protein
MFAGLVFFVYVLCNVVIRKKSMSYTFSIDNLKFYSSEATVYTVSS